MDGEYNQEEINKFVFDMFNQRQERLFLSFRKNLFTEKDIEKFGLETENTELFEEFLKSKFNQFFKFCKKPEKKNNNKKQQKEICEFTIGSGPRKGEQCNKSAKDSSQFCGMHSKKMEKMENEENEEKPKKEKKKKVEEETEPLTENEKEESEIDFDD